MGSNLKFIAVISALIRSPRIARRYAFFYCAVDAVLGPRLPAGPHPFRGRGPEVA
jgi:hypothetical protein